MGRALVQPELENFPSLDWPEISPRLSPAVRAALQHSTRPEKLFTVFAGQDKEATEQARSYFVGYPPSSPSIAILRDGKVVHMMHRSDIEHREASDIASELKRAFDQFCDRPVAQ